MVIGLPESWWNSFEWLWSCGECKELCRDSLVVKNRIWVKFCRCRNVNGINKIYHVKNWWCHTNHLVVVVWWKLDEFTKSSVICQTIIIQKNNYINNILADLIYWSNFLPKSSWIHFAKHYCHQIFLLYGSFWESDVNFVVTIIICCTLQAWGQVHLKVQK